MPDEDIKTADKRYVSDIIESCKKFGDRVHLKSGGVANALEHSEKLKLSLALKWLNLPFLNKRIEGLVDISYYCKILNNKTSHLPSQQRKEQEAIWMSSKFLTAWLISNNIFDYMFDKTAHIEIIRRTGDILQLLATEGKLTDKDIDRIWDASLGQHESITHHIWTLLGNLSRYLSATLLDHLFEKIKSKPFSEYDSQYIYFITNVTESGIHQSQISKSEHPNKSVYGFNLLWSACLDNSGLSVDNAFHCYNCLHRFIDKIDQNEWISKCMELLKDRTSIYQAATFLNAIINKSNSNAKILILSLQSQYGLTQLLFDCISTYIESVIEKKKQLSSDVNLDDHIFCGYYRHSQYIEHYLSLLEPIFKYTKITVSQLDILWSLLVTNAMTENTRNSGLAWFRNNVDVLGNFSQHIFEKKIPMLDFRQLSQKGFDLVCFYFDRINNNQMAENKSTNQYFVGLDYIWRIVLTTENEEVATLGINFINNLHKNSTNNSIIDTRDLREKLLSTALQNLFQASYTYTEKNKTMDTLLFHQIVRSLKLIQNYIESLEHGLLLERHGTAARKPDLQIKVKDPSHKIYNIDTHTSENIGEFHYKVSQAYQDGRYPPEMIRLIAFGKELDKDDVLMKDVTMQNGVIHFIIRQTLPGNASGHNFTRSLSHEEKLILPSAILAQDEYFDKFFQLMNIFPDKICTLIWDILDKLPTNLKLKHSIQNITESSNWNEILDPSNIFILYYSLQVVEILVHNTKEDTQQKQTWISSFIKSGGCSYLLKTLLSNDFFESTQGNNKRIICLGLLLRLINFFLLDDIKLREVLSIPHQELLDKLMNLILMISIQQNPTNTNVDLSEKTEYDDVVIAAMPLLVALLGNQPQLLTNFSKVAYTNWIESVLLSSRFPRARQAVAKGLKTLCFKFSFPEQLKTLFYHLYRFLPKLTVQPSNNPYTYKCEEFFYLFTRLLKHLCLNVQSPDYLQLLQEVLKMIQEHPILENTASMPEDKLLKGLLDTARTIISSEKIVHKTEVGQVLIPQIFKDCLFDIPNIHSKLNPPKCKTSGSRKAAFDFLLALITNNNENMIILCGMLIDYHLKQPKKKQWHYHPQDYEKSDCGYTGLKNLGATCYMNSLMQQLFMVDQFRYQILSSPILSSGPEPEQPNSNTERENVLYQLQSIFANLQESQKKYFDTKKFCQNYKIGGETIKTNEQMDVDEFFTQLFDKIDSSLKGTNKERLLSNFFGGTLINQIIPKECDHRSERAETCYNIQLEVKNKSKLVDSLDLFVQGDMLDGDNKFYCDTCKTKVAALKRCCIGKLPNHLIIHLKRFEFDLELMRRSKVNEYCEFPSKLNLEPYTAEGLFRRENAEKTGTPQPSGKPLHYYDYELTGILVHSGSTEFGHYYSFIKDTVTNQWYQFNDMHVTPFDPEHIFDQCYGGYETKQVFDHNLRKMVPKMVIKNYSAYLLFYERCHPETPTVEKVIPRTSQSESVPKDLYSRVWEKNLKFLMDKHLFDKGYLNFVKSLIELYDPVKITTIGPVNDEAILFNNHTDPFHMAIKLGTHFLVQIYAHIFDKKHLPQYIKHLSLLYTKHVPSCQWLISQLYKDPSWIKEILFSCTISDTREIFAKFIGNVLKTLDVYQSPYYDQFSPDISVIPQIEEGKEPSEQDVACINGMKLLTIPGMPKALILKFLISILQLSYEAKPHWKNYHHFWLLFQEFTSISPKLKQFIISSGIFRLFCHIYMGEESPFFVGQKVDKNNKEMVANHRLSLQNMKYLLGAISTIICSCKMPRDNQNPKSPTEQEGVELLELGPEDINMIYHTQFLSQSMLDDSNNEAMANIARHMCWDNMKRSVNFIELICENVHKYEGERFVSFLYVLKALLSLQDSNQEQRVRIALSKLLRVISDNIQYKTATRHAIAFFAEYIPENKLVAEYLLKKLDWIKPWLCYSVNSNKRENGEELVRYTAEIIIQELVPELRGYQTSVKPDFIPTSARTNVKLPEQTENTIHRLHTIYRTILPLLQCVNSSALESNSSEKNSDSDVDPALFRFVSLFRILQWCIISPVERQIFFEKAPNVNKDYISLFLEAYEAVEKSNGDKDCNKREILRLWDKLTYEQSNIINRFTEDRNVRTTIFYTKVSLGSNKGSIQYNSETLPIFYGLFHRFAQASEVFRNELYRHNNFDWAVRYVLLGSTEYRKAGEYLEQILIASIKNNQIRHKWTENMLRVYLPNAHLNYRAVFDVLAHLLQSEQEQIFFCSMSGYQHIQDILTKKKTWPNLDELRALVSACTASIQWCKNNSPDTPHYRDLVDSNYLHDVVDAITNSFGELNTNHLAYVKVIAEFCNDVISIDPKLVKNIFEALYLNKLPPYSEPLSEWRKIYIFLCASVSDKILTTIPQYAPYVFILITSMTKEALNNSIETLYSCIKLLRVILINYSSTLFDFISSERTALINITSKLLSSYFDLLLDEDKLFHSFITHIYPEISGYLSADKRNQIISNFQSNLQKSATPSEHLSGLLTFLKER